MLKHDIKKKGKYDVLLPTTSYKKLNEMKKIKYTIYSIMYYLMRHFNKFIIGENFVFDRIFFFKKTNWGDDLNKYLIEYITNKKVINIPVSEMNIKYTSVYSMVGSILSFYSLDNKIIYGTGLMDPSDELKGEPEKIFSVRGPKTRMALMAKGYECPTHYGDPALLLPIFFAPTRKKYCTGCLILNMGTDLSNCLTVSILRDKLNLSIVSMTEYEKWTDVVDQIVSSSFVISESLHGLIVAETYGVPNVWVEFKDHPDYWNFKFEDFYESIGKTEKIIKLQDGVDIDLINKKIRGWKKANINYKEMITYFPFEIKCPINRAVLDGIEND